MSTARVSNGIKEDDGNDKGTVTEATKQLCCLINHVILTPGPPVLPKT